MDDNLQRVFSVLISTIIFFMLPLYIAFEKKDDISYALALKITSNFVDEASSKGYISKNMYEQFVSDLALTGNLYEIKMEHVAKKYYPTIYSYTDSNNSQIQENGLAKFDYSIYAGALTSGKITESGKDYENLKFAYNLSEEVYTENRILETLSETLAEDLRNNYGSYTIDSVPLYPTIYSSNGKDLYTMNIGDEFNVSVKNTNTTIATVLFNTLTFGANSGNLPKVYINYGATIQNDDYKNNNLDMIDTTP